jgi:hypothetical protein
MFFRKSASSESDANGIAFAPSLVSLGNGEISLMKLSHWAAKINGIFMTSI